MLLRYAPVMKPFRRSNDRIIAGVCAGIAEWLGWDANTGRFLFVLISVMSVIIPGILVYGLLWLTMPAPEPPSEQGPAR